LPAQNNLFHSFCRKAVPVVLLLLTSCLASGQVRVETKPLPPKTQLNIPAKPEEGFVLLPGRWIWHQPARMYVWLSPVWVLPPRGKTWSPGCWKPVRKGWLWVPGKWVRQKRFRGKKGG